MRFAALLGLVLIVNLAGAPVVHAQSVLISELADPRLNYLTDRFIEIANTGGSAVDLTGWSLVAVGNGADIFTWNLSGTIQPGEALVAGDQTTVVAFPVDFPAEAWSTSNSTWNGKVGDGAKLLNASSTLIDYMVADGVRFENLDYVRNLTVTSPSTSYNPAEWTGTPIDFPTEGSPGSHGAGASVPVIANIQTVPAAPAAGETVQVSAEVTDAVATITSVELRWGTASNSLVNTIPMALQTGDTWLTGSSIPAQSGGTTVYFEIEATNDEPASTISGIQSYGLAPAASIYDIQAQNYAKHDVGATVRTQGVVTAVYGTSYVIQDGSGPWSGLWVDGTPVPATGDSVDVQGEVTETFGSGFDGTTFLANASVLSSVPATLPAPAVLTTGTAFAEAYEGVLVAVPDADCTNPDLGGGIWQVNDGSGAGRVGELGYDSSPTLGTRYDVTGPLLYASGAFHLEPRFGADILWSGDTFTPLLLAATADDLTTVRVTFSEALDATTAQNAVNYVVSGTSVFSAALVGGDPSEVLLTTTVMASGIHTVTVSGVEDLYGNAVTGAMASFDVSPYSPPAGYYASAEGMTGDALRLELHYIIDNHTVRSYDFAQTAFETTDDKPNGKVWDMYSDIPGGTPPYEYTFGVDEGASASAEGQGYNREHSWPRSWFGGAVSPMNSDLFQLYPSDIYMNSLRGSYPYGEVSSPTYTSLNGTKLGLNTYPGYTGTVFEPLDDFKGDFARSFFYMTVRYYTEDGSWPGSDMTDGADLLPWAQDMLIEWHQADPVSEKERERNHVIYGFQANRNPFIDRPDFVAPLFGLTSGVADEGLQPFHLLANTPNPFRASTTIQFELEEDTEVTVEVFDIQGRRIRSLLSGHELAGAHRVIWNGTDASNRRVPAGLYFYRVVTDEAAESRKMLLLR